MKKFIIAATVFVLCAALCSCGSVSRLDLGAVEEEETSSPAPLSSISALEDEVVVKNTSEIKIGFSASFDSRELLDAGVAGFSEYCDAVGVAYEVREANGSAQKQAEDIAAFVAGGFDAIAVSPAGDGISEAVSAAADAGIPIISITDVPGASVVIEPGDHDFAKIAAEKLLKLSGAQIAILDTTDESPRMQKRRDAYKLVTEAAGAVVLAREAVSSIQEASAAAASIVEQYPQLGGILCVDTNGLIGAAEAVEPGAGVVVGGAELQGEVLGLMEQGRVQVAAAQFARKQGSLAAEAALGLALGEYYPPVIEATSKVYTQFDWQDASYELQGLEPPQE